MGELDRHCKISKKLYDRLVNSADNFGIFHRRYAGLLVKQVALAVQQRGERIRPFPVWKQYLANSRISFHVLAEIGCWQIVDDYSKKFVMNQSDTVRQFLLVALDYLGKHPHSIPEDITVDVVYPKRAA